MVGQASVGASPRPWQLAIGWLKSAQREDGSWGEDTWDTCLAIKALLRSGVRAEESCVITAIAYLKDRVDAGWALDEQAYWFGPAFISAAMEVFNLIGDLGRANACLAQLWEFWEEGGRFEPPLENGRNSSVRAPTVWHTACAIIGLYSFGTPPSLDRVSQSLRWLLDEQDDSGCWNAGRADMVANCTLEATVAIVAAEGAFAAPAVKATQWFIDTVTDRAFASFNVDFMAAIAIAETSGRDLNATFDYVFVDDLQRLLGQYDAQLVTMAGEHEASKSQYVGATSELASLRESTTALQSDLAAAHAARDSARESEAELQRRMATYALRLTNNQLAVIGLILTILTFAAGVVLTLGFG